MVLVAAALPCITRASSLLNASALRSNATALGLEDLRRRTARAKEDLREASAAVAAQVREESAMRAAWLRAVVDAPARLREVACVAEASLAFGEICVKRRREEE